MAFRPLCRSKRFRSATAFWCCPASASRWTRRFSKAAPPWTNRCSPANRRRSRASRGAAFWPVRSTTTAPSPAGPSRWARPRCWRRSRAWCSRRSARARPWSGWPTAPARSLFPSCWFCRESPLSSGSSPRTRFRWPWPTPSPCWWSPAPAPWDLAVPAALTVAVGRGAQLGVLFKGGEALERLAHLDAIVLDKTGTLTVGRPVLEGVHSLAGQTRERSAAPGRRRRGAVEPSPGPRHCGCCAGARSGLAACRRRADSPRPRPHRQGRRPRLPARQ